MSAINDIVSFWAKINPAAGYTGGFYQTIPGLFFQTEENLNSAYTEISVLKEKCSTISDENLQTTALRVLTALETQLKLARPSGAGPSGTGAGGVYSAADGIFYSVLKGDSNAPYISTYLDTVLRMVEFETERWKEGNYTVEVCKECLNTADYMLGTLSSLVQNNPGIEDKVNAIKSALKNYSAIFARPGLESNDFKVLWKAFQDGDSAVGPMKDEGYPAVFQNYYSTTYTPEYIEAKATEWLDSDMKVVGELSDRIINEYGLPENSTLQQVWDAVSEKYKVDPKQCGEEVEKACNNFGQKYIIGFTKEDNVQFGYTPDYLVNLVTGGEDFAVDYLTDNPMSQLYLTTNKNTSLLTMINILVHEFSHGYNFVLSAKHAGSPILNVNTSLEVPLTEGQAFYREYQYWEAAQQLLPLENLNDVQQAYLNLYGKNIEEQIKGVEASKLETYIWRVVRYIRALCDVQVCGGKQTYTDFVEWASKRTGLSVETLHGECFTFMATPGYAPCYALPGMEYGELQKQGLDNGVSELDFNTFASGDGFYPWTLESKILQNFIEAK